MTNLERMILRLITPGLVRNIAGVFGVDTVTQAQVNAMRVLVGSQFPAWQKAIEEQTEVLRQAHVNRANLERLKDALDPDDPRLGAVDAALNALMTGWPNAGGEE